MQDITIVGGGLAGLVAAISVAEKGGGVMLNEAHSRLGGRAHTARGDHRVNYGPHALYRHGAFEEWLIERRLLPPVTFPSLTGLRLISRGKLRRMPSPLLPMIRSARLEAPVGASYRDWAGEQLGERAAEAAIGFASLPTFHGDPGALSAAFVHERIQRSITWRPVYYVLGGWQVLVDGLAARARELGVRIVTRERIRRLPDGPVIVAMSLEGAAEILDEPSLAWPRVETAIYDVAIETRRGDPAAVLSLDDRLYASNYSGPDPSSAPEGESLIQVSAGLREGEAAAAAWARIEGVLDLAYSDWRARVKWRRQAVAEGGAGPADPPGRSWHDRPAIDRGAGRWLAGDHVAAPGILSEVSFASGRRAAELAVASCLGGSSPDRGESTQSRFTDNRYARTHRQTKEDRLPRAGQP